MNHQLQFLPSTCFLDFQRSSTQVPRGPGSLVVSVQSPGSDGRPPGTSPSATCWRQVEGQSQRAASETGATSLHTRAHSDRLWGAVQVPVTVRDDLASEKGQVGRDGTSSYPSLCTPPQHWPSAGDRAATETHRRCTRRHGVDRPGEYTTRGRGDRPGGRMGGWMGGDHTGSRCGRRDPWAKPPPLSKVLIWFCFSSRLLLPDP